MQENTNTNFNKIRKTPIVIIFFASAFFHFLSAYRGGSYIFTSLGHVTFTTGLLLAIMAWFNFEINRTKEDEKDLESHDAEPPYKVKSLAQYLPFLYKKYDTEKEEDQPDYDNSQNIEEQSNVEEKDNVEDGLIEIKKETTTQLEKSSKSLYIYLAEIFYVLIFLVLAFWRINSAFSAIPIGFIETYNAAIVDSILLLAFPCLSMIYLKMRKNNGEYLADKVSYDFLKILSFVVLIYAAIITIQAVLELDILVVLNWLFYITTIYVIGAFLFNILLATLKKSILTDFNYIILPTFFKNLDKTHSPNILASLNISVKSLYTVEYTIKLLPGLLLLLSFILLLSTTIFVVQPYQQGAVFRLGRLNHDSIVGQGIHFKLPWPIEHVQIHDVYRLNSMQIGFLSTVGFNNLWTEAHEGSEHLLLLGDGNELVAVNVVVVYQINDLYSHILNISTPESLLMAHAYEILLRRTSNTSLDSFLSVDRNSLSINIANELSKFSYEHRLGIEVVQVIIEGIHPPIDVAEVYQRVVTASLEKNTLITTATSEATQIIIDAQKRSQVTINYALANQHKRVGDAMLEMAIFNAAIEAYAINPDSFRLVKELEAYESLIANTSLYVFSSGVEDSIPSAVLRPFNNIVD